MSTHNLDEEEKIAGFIASNATVAHENEPSSSAQGNDNRKRQKSSSSKESSTINGMDEGVTRQLLQCLPRTQLENLVFHSIQTSTALSVDDLQQNLPSDLQWKGKVIADKKSSVKQQIAKGPSRVGTGSFDAVNDECMRLILFFLPLQERIPCISRVCKAWREYKNLPGLWENLTMWDTHPRESKSKWFECNCE
jgi:hypothetical protein